MMFYAVVAVGVLDGSYENAEMTVNWHVLAILWSVQNSRSSTRALAVLTWLLQSVANAALTGLDYIFIIECCFVCVLVADNAAWVAWSCRTMGKDIDLVQAVRDEDLSLLQKLLDRSRAQRSSKYHVRCDENSENFLSGLKRPTIVSSG